MIPEYGETIYKILAKIVKLNFKAQIKDSGIVLKRLYRMINLESAKENYLLLLNEESFYFENQEDFIQEFIIILKKNIYNFNEQYKDLRNRENEVIIDENAIYLEDEFIGQCSSKQIKLLNKMREFREEILKNKSNSSN